MRSRWIAGVACASACVVAVWTGSAEAAAMSKAKVAPRSKAKAAPGFLHAVDEYHARARDARREARGWEGELTAQPLTLTPAGGWWEGVEGAPKLRGREGGQQLRGRRPDTGRAVVLVAAGGRVGLVTVDC